MYISKLLSSHRFLSRKFSEQHNIFVNGGVCWRYVVVDVKRGDEFYLRIIRGNDMGHYVMIFSASSAGVR